MEKAATKKVLVTRNVCLSPILVELTFLLGHLVVVEVIKVMKILTETLVREGQNLTIEDKLLNCKPGCTLHSRRLSNKIVIWLKLRLSTLI